ncbi:MAG TPA: patatin-like phospholipase family protein [Gemmataceae bacterium]|nr:patatin-like phospholipase family protein [Gemmataceae bacterium]
MNKIGLALSGGGFRASLYHLGLVRFLRDAGILSQVSHITSVSGGSILAAHLVLNWDRYNGSPEDFEAAASELISFVRLDVRNRILRRFPLTIPLRWLSWLVGLPTRKLSRTGLLEYHYEKFLYGDKSLFELPEQPRLHILATNLSEGCLCGFSRDGLLMMRRRAEGVYRADCIHVGLATVAMAVTASSAFPGFFPPLELRGVDVGAVQGEFGRQAYTDGGVFDNLGVRMFRFLEDESGPKTTLVSDVGKRIEVQGQRRAGGLIRTALRATDILMDRVWQLESETFRGTRGFVFAPITDVVWPHDDPTALHPVIQRQLANVRTDIDHFSDLEISGLVRHGYCVARKVCKSRPDLFGEELPKDCPWDPISKTDGAAVTLPSTTGFLRMLRGFAPAEGNEDKSAPAADTLMARKLQDSAARRIWSRMLGYRDWVSYIYVPIIVPLLIVVPYVTYKAYQHSNNVKHLMESLAQGSADLKYMSELLDGPKKPWTGEPAEEVGEIDEPDLKGFKILQDSHILDLRKWSPASAGKTSAEYFLYGYRRLKVWKLREETGNNQFRIRLLPTSPLTQVRFPRQELQPKLLVHHEENSVTGAKDCRWEMSVNCDRVAPGDLVEILEEHLSPGDFVRDNGGSATLTFEPAATTAELTRWILMPEGREYRSHRLLRYKKGKPETMEVFKFATEYLATNYSILAFKLLALDPGYVYELTWYYE